MYSNKGKEANIRKKVYVSQRKKKKKRENERILLGIEKVLAT